LAAGNDMNCEDYKQIIGADPDAKPEGAAEHIAACVDCRQFTAEMVALNARMAKALKINVPPRPALDLPPIDGSPDNERHSNVVGLHARKPQSISTPTWLAIAASFAVAAFIGLQFFAGNVDDGLNLADEVLAHVDHEPQALVVTNVAVSEDSLSRVVNPTVGTLSAGLGLVSYARTCIINGKPVPHLVIQGENGPVTVLLMPEEMIDGPLQVDGESVNGVILPVGNGSIAIIGEDSENLEEVQQQVLDSVEFTI